MVAVRTDHENYVTHVFCEPCILSFQVSTLSPRYEEILRTGLATHATCESTGPDFREAQDAEAYSQVMDQARANVGLPAAS